LLSAPGSGELSGCWYHGQRNRKATFSAETGVAVGRFGKCCS
jgi:hypothetical protein